MDAHAEDVDIKEEAGWRSLKPVLGNQSVG